jgi:hypothetical protein
MLLIFEGFFVPIFLTRGILKTKLNTNYRDLLSKKSIHSLYFHGKPARGRTRILTDSAKKKRNRKEVLANYN